LNEARAKIRSQIQAGSLLDLGRNATHPVL
jgi:hypothetical protein